MSVQKRAALHNRRSTPTARFLTAVGEEVGAAALSPAAMARAVVRVLPVDAAGFSTLTEMLRVPLGASNGAAQHAEVLQTSLGQGPCLAAAASREPVAVDLVEMGERWPLYCEELLRLTPFRSVAAVPLYAPGRGVYAALDLYAKGPRLSDRLDVAVVEERIGRPAAALLSTCLDEVTDVDPLEEKPAWYQDAAGRRHGVWVAIGMVMGTQAQHASRPQDALSLLRAQAQRRGETLDDLAADVVDGRLPPTDLSS